MPKKQFPKAKRSETLTRWLEAREEAEEAKAVIANERALRRLVAELYFPDPEEGTNTVEFKDGTQLKYSYRINREYDEGAMQAVGELIRKEGDDPDAYVQWKPQLVISAYRKASEAVTRYLDMALVAKPGSPELKIIAPKIVPSED